MPDTGTKTVRFTKVVERSGEPRVHTLWVAPDKDPELKRAQSAHRVMTIEPRAIGGNTDVGVVGFDATSTKPRQFLIFPRSLKRFEGARIIGIKFDLVAQPKLADASTLKTASGPKRRTVRSSRKRPPLELPKRTPESHRSPRPPTGDKVVSFESPASAERPAADPPPATTPKPEEKSAPSNSSGSNHALIRAVRAALKELKAGKSVAAYQRLERALEHEV